MPSGWLVIDKTKTNIQSSKTGRVTLNILTELPNSETGCT